MSRNNITVLVIGTGTIGEPLISLLSDFNNEIGVSRVFFHKRTPLAYEVSKLKALCARGAKLVVDDDRIQNFIELDCMPTHTLDDALNLSDVVIDCTPAGNINKRELYNEFEFHSNRPRVFIAQGSAAGFGVPYANGINDTVLLRDNPSFIQVVSCNTHNIAALIRVIPKHSTQLISGDFVCIRRASDISQNKSFIASPHVDEHHNILYGTHHAEDVARLYKTIDRDINVFSSAMKVNTQYMHVVRFNMRLYEIISRDKIISRIRESDFIALTKKQDTGRVFSFGRDHGYYGRLFNQAIINEQSLRVVGNNDGTTTVTGFSFTSQDGNSLISSLAATLWAIHGKGFRKKLKFLDNYLFNEI